MKSIIFGGGCFWGVEAYFQKIDGIIHTEVGYANSLIPHPSYEQVCMGYTNAVEVVKIDYQESKVSLEILIEQLMTIIDPYSLNQQGNDVGTQYRVGIYTVDEESLIFVRNWIEKYEMQQGRTTALEIMGVINFCLAEDYHQSYLQKNPRGYCHINLNAVPSHLRKK